MDVRSRECSCGGSNKNCNRCDGRGWYEIRCPAAASGKKKKNVRPDLGSRWPKPVAPRKTKKIVRQLVSVQPPKKPQVPPALRQACRKIGSSRVQPPKQPEVPPAVDGSPKPRPPAPYSLRGKCSACNQTVSARGMRVHRCGWIWPTPGRSSEASLRWSPKAKTREEKRIQKRTNKEKEKAATKQQEQRAKEELPTKRRKCRKPRDVVAGAAGERGVADEAGD